MSGETRQIKGRIKSVKNTKKVTKAMELVAAAKMRKAVERGLSSRQYAVLAWQLALRLSTSQTIPVGDYLHRFFHPVSDPKKVLLIALASNRGLCGAYNSNVIKQVLAFLRHTGKEKVEVVALGKRLVSALSSFGVTPTLAFEKEETAFDARSIVQVANYAYEGFKKGDFDAVYLVYSDYKSALIQQTVLRPLFPFDPEQSALSDIQSIQTRRKLESVSEIKKEVSYIYEPQKRKVLSYLVPRLGESQLYQALLESNASEHSARMMAMKNATEAAGDMFKDLTLQYNRARQAAITQEIAEISAGSAAIM